MAPKLSPFLRKDLFKANLEFEATRSGFGRGVAFIGSTQKKLLAITADLSASTCLTTFKKKFPKRFIDVGVAEQSLAGIAAGLASEGFIVVATSFAAFNPGRNWDFIRTQIALNNLPVILIGSHAGLATGPDGATHQSLEDVSLLRSLPTVSISSPCDSLESSLIIRHAVTQKTPFYLRLSRQKTPILFSKKKIPLGKAITLCSGSHITIATTGITAWECLQASNILWDQFKISASIIHFGSLAPFDEQAVKKIKTKNIISIEDHSINGGLGSCVAEAIAKHSLNKRLIRMGTTSFGQSGSYENLYKHYNLHHKKIVKQVRKILKK